MIVTLSDMLVLLNMLLCHGTLLSAKEAESIIAAGSVFVERKRGGVYRRSILAAVCAEGCEVNTVLGCVRERGSGPFGNYIFLHI